MKTTALKKMEPEKQKEHRVQKVTRILEMINQNNVHDPLKLKVEKDDEYEFSHENSVESKEMSSQEIRNKFSKSKAASNNVDILKRAQTFEITIME